MDNFNGFPATYQQPNMYYQPTWTQPVYNFRNLQNNTTAYPNYQPQNQSAINPVSNSNIIWVQGESGAKAFNVPNGQTMALWDSENQVIYIKQVDASGKPSMTVLDYIDRNAPVQKAEEKVEYVTLEQFNELNSKVSDITQRLNDFKSSVNSNNRKGNNNGKSVV